MTGRVPAQRQRAPIELLEKKDSMSGRGSLDSGERAPRRRQANSAGDRALAELDQSPTGERAQMVVNAICRTNSHFAADLAQRRGESVGHASGQDAETLLLTGGEVAHHSARAFMSAWSFSMMRRCDSARSRSMRESS